MKIAPYVAKKDDWLTSWGELSTGKVDPTGETTVEIGKACNRKFGLCPRSPACRSAPILYAALALPHEIDLAVLFLVQQRHAFSAPTSFIPELYNYGGAPAI